MISCGLFHLEGYGKVPLQDYRQTYQLYHISALLRQNVDKLNLSSKSDAEINQGVQRMTKVLEQRFSGYRKKYCHESQRVGDCDFRCIRTIIKIRDDIREQHEKICKGGGYDRIVAKLSDEQELVRASLTKSSVDEALATMDVVIQHWRKQFPLIPRMYSSGQNHLVGQLEIPSLKKVNMLESHEWLL